MICPVCGRFEFEECGDFDICQVCGYENDNLQNDDHNLAGGANPLSVNELRIEHFLLRTPVTRKRARALHEAYNADCRAIGDEYDGIDRSAEPERAEAESLAYKKLRTRYMNDLNELMGELID